ncbi:flagellar protein FlgN [Sagittula stellata]|uniref:Uncharacterized protein n=1 Tax=Sagittula stellata (strain ATCC 700073 / DSM 11524 / E-37) TaxID=388399 RepID=A3K320_SAGS3|nr:flagellar protein FlgN [Sagittula stellata]EBA08579.1 hypothetical protein SSE37_17243 [Sagittula stellata E-37]
MDERTLSQQLEELIDAERTALINGDFDRIAELLEEKQRLIGSLHDLPLDRQTVAPLSDGLRRNQELFDAALAGIRNVAARLGDLNRVRKSVETYDSKGKKHSLDAPDVQRLERRA